MPIHRTAKNENYVVMSNEFLRKRNLSIKAKGLLAYMLSLPDDWKFTISGLTSQLKECKSSISGMLSELEQHGYLRRSYPRGTDGKIIEAIYDVYEKPILDSPILDFPMPELPSPEITPTVIQSG